MGVAGVVQGFESKRLLAYKESIFICKDEINHACKAEIHSYKDCIFAYKDVVLVCKVCLQSLHAKKKYTIYLACKDDRPKGVLESGDYSDFLLLIGGKEFRVHKAILAAQSEVFAAMFNADLEEKMMNRAEIGDMDVDACQMMLSYIYGAKVDKLDEMDVDLLVAADKYQLKHLKCICERSLSLSLTTESVVKALVMADMHQANELKCECIAFIGANFAAVKSTESWKMMRSQPDLLMELFDKMSIN